MTFVPEGFCLHKEQITLRKKIYNYLYGEVNIHCIFKKHEQVFDLPPKTLSISSQVFSSTYAAWGVNFSKNSVHDSPY